MDALALKVEHMSANPTAALAVDCEICGTKGHLAPECNMLTESNSDQVNYAQGNPFSTTYNPGWRNHPNLSYKNNNPIQNSTPQRPPDEVEELDGQKDQEVKDKGEDKEKVYVPLSPYKPPIPYPQRLKQTKIDNQYKKLNDPKPLECNSIAENKLAKKEKDPRSFYIPCILGNHVIDKAFLDLGASVSLIPLAVSRRLTLGELQPTKMSLQLADRSVKYPVGILEDIPLRIRQLYIPTDFVVMDIKEDAEIPILLGRPFLSTVGAIIDLKRGKLTFEVSDEKIEFIPFKFLMAPVIEDSCYAIDIIDECIRELDQ
ncbi:uncharacterized protein LOC127095637 [Lathyrus oleraceus]|uniref:uncharacterized protein LOC127095637 n=1 Tax=Pisum sativum TaxID=3888 RepID=UPI0021D1F16D|nr:uncharacterized protein LOC127095637 [Pisum sativum]